MQTPTLGFVVDRELEREAFVPQPFFEVRVAAGGIDFKVWFCADRSRPGAWVNEKDKFDPVRTSDRDLAASAFSTIKERGRLRLTNVVAKVRGAKPKPPFTTDTLLQEAGTRFGWGTAKTSLIATGLYNAGHITYTRTDSTRTSEAARVTIRESIRERWGEAFVGAPDNEKQEAAGKKIEWTLPSKNGHVKSGSVECENGRWRLFVRGWRLRRNKTRPGSENRACN